MKYFISQPMANKTEDYITKERNRIIDTIKRSDPEAEIIDSYIKEYPVDNSPYKNKPVWYLSKSIGFLSEADVAVFAPGYSNARGCYMEYQIAKQYGITCKCFRITKDGVGVLIDPEVNLL